MNWQNSAAVSRCSVFQVSKASTRLLIEIAPTTEIASHLPPPLNNSSPRGRYCEGCAGQNRLRRSDDETEHRGAGKEFPVLQRRRADLEILATE